jgi:hypothetical protein
MNTELGRLFFVVCALGRNTCSGTIHAMNGQEVFVTGQTGIHPLPAWMPAYAGMTMGKKKTIWKLQLRNIAGEHMLINTLRLNRFSPYFHQLINTTPLTIIQALMMIRSVTRSTSRKNSAVRINEK